MLNCEDYIGLIHLLEPEIFYNLSKIAHHNIFYLNLFQANHTNSYK